MQTEEKEMTENEKKKEYLRQYRIHVRRIHRINAEIAELRSMKISPSMNNDGMPHGSSQEICPVMLQSLTVWYRS